MSELYFDDRWCAPHGIGRFATEVRRRLSGFADLPLRGSPTGPLDAYKLASCLRRSGAKGFFSPGFNVPAWARCSVVTTVHDLIHVRFESESTAIKRAYYRFIQRPIVRRSPVTLTVSEYSRQQIIEWYGVREDRVAVVGNGVSDEFVAEGESLPSERPYFLYVGNARPHKNLESLLRAFAIVQHGNDVDLKLVTKPTANLQRRIESLSIGRLVEFCAGLEDADLARYYRGAVALVLPSHFEGFGLPLVEAMACGCPVIASNRTAIPEVVGGAGLQFDPNSIEQLADAMQQLTQDSRKRESMIALGLDRAKDFRWSSVAAKVQGALQPIMD